MFLFVTYINFQLAHFVLPIDKSNVTIFYIMNVLGFL